jgi:hypothetical protein
MKYKIQFFKSSPPFKFGKPFTVLHPASYEEIVSAFLEHNPLFGRKALLDTTFTALPILEGEERDNPLINAARGRDASGINEDELS